MIVAENVTIDLTPIRRYTGTLIPDNPIELKLVELYRYEVNETNDPIEIFTAILLNKIYKDDKDHKYNEISHFYPEKEYIFKVCKFLSIITHIILNKIGPDFLDIVYSKTIRDDDKYEVEFKITKHKD